jgi:hypothetical protein
MNERKLRIAAVQIKPALMDGEKIFIKLNAILRRLKEFL